MATIFRSPGIQRIWRRPDPAPPTSQSTNTLVTTLKSQDKFFGASGMGPAYDYPNPRGKPYPSDLRTFLNSVALKLIGKDQFFAAAGMGPTYAWPNPERPRYAIDLKTFTSFNLPLVSGILPPFYQLSWPNPNGPRYPSDLRTFLNSIEIQLAGKDQFFYAAGEGPTYDYPNPRGYTYSIGLRTFTDPLKLNLNGKDQFFGGAGQAPANLNWPVPRGYAYATDLRTHLGTWANFYSSPPVVVSDVGDPFKSMGIIQQMGLSSVLNSSMGLE